MEWIKLPVSRLQSQEFLTAEPQQQAAWLKMLSYCASQENSGIISACRGWSPQAWMMVVGINPEELRGPDCALWHWEGESLHVWAYCIEEQQLLHKKRAGGKAGGSRSPSSTPSSTPSKDCLQQNRIEKRREEENRAEQTDCVSQTHPDTRFWKASLSDLKSLGAKIGKASQDDWVALLTEHGLEAVQDAVRRQVTAGKDAWHADVAAHLVRNGAKGKADAKVKRQAFLAEWEQECLRAQEAVDEQDRRYSRMRLLINRDDPSQIDLSDLRDLLS